MEKSPDAFRTISEVAEQLDLPQHVLRFWETRFNQIKPMKRSGGRRYYRPGDVDLLRGIRHLLYEQGYTIKGVQKLFKENGVASVVALGSGDIAAINAVLQGRQSDFIDDFTEDTQEYHGALSHLTDEEGDITIGQLPPSLKNKDGKESLQDALLELMECKRILDRARTK